MVRIKRPNPGTPPPAQPPVKPTGSPVVGGGNPIFDSDPAVHAEAKRQLKLIDRELKTPRKNGKGQHNLLHVLRGILEADRLGFAISTAAREQFLSPDDATIPQTEQLLRELEEAGYLEVAVRRQKNHDYRPTKKARNTWSSVQLWEAVSQMKQQLHYGRDFSEEHYLVPFDAGIYLDRVPSRDPQNLPLGFQGFQLLPCGEGTVAVGFETDYSGWSGSRRKLVFLDLRDQELKHGDYGTGYHERLYRYVDFPNLAEELDTLLSQVGNRSVAVVPRYVVKNGPQSTADNSFILRNGKAEHFQVPQAFLLYLYNNYFGEDLDIQVSSKPTGIGAYNMRFGARARENHDPYLIVVSRAGSRQPLLLYRFEQIREQLATIV